MGIPTLVAALEAQLAYVLDKQNEMSARQEEMSAKQDEMASDLKQLLAFFLPKPT
jgi:hypothetical protein